MTLQSRIATHLRSGQVSRVVYGSIIGLALVLTLEAHPPSLGVAISTLVATALAVGLAELYSEVIGGRARTAMGGPPESVGAIAGDALAVAFGVAFPSVFFVAAAFGLFDYDLAFALAKWTGLGLIAAYGYVAGRLSGSGPGRALLEAGAVALVGGALIVLKALVH